MRAVDTGSLQQARRCGSHPAQIGMPLAHLDDFHKVTSGATFHSADYVNMHPAAARREQKCERHLIEVFTSHATART